MDSYTTASCSLDENSHASNPHYLSCEVVWEIIHFSAQHLGFLLGVRRDGLLLLLMQAAHLSKTSAEFGCNNVEPRCFFWLRRFTLSPLTQVF